MDRKVAALLAVALLVGCADAQISGNVSISGTVTMTPLSFGSPLWSGVLAPARATDWTQAGIPGGIPSGSWTQCGSTIAAYGTIGSPQSCATITNAITACTGQSKYVKLGNGDFYLSGGCRNVGVNGVEVRGGGPQSTKLHMADGGSTCQAGNGSCLFGFESSDGTYPTAPPANIYNWTAGYAQGATTITLSNLQNITAGVTILVLDQCDTGTAGTPCVGPATDNGGYFNSGSTYLATSTGSGTVNTQNGASGSCTANCVTRVSGTSFPSTWSANSAIQINGTYYIIQNVWSGNLIQLNTLTPPGTQAGVAFSVTTGGNSYNGPDEGIARPNRFQWEIAIATACSPACGTNSAGTVTIDRPLVHPNWGSGQNPQAWLIQPSRNVGVRDLMIDGTSSTATAGLSFYNDVNVWAKNVVVHDTHSIGIYLTQVDHADVESSYVFNPGQGNLGNDPSGYNYDGSNLLITNNICQNCHVGYFGNGPVTGSVVSYNVCENTFTGDGFLFGCIWDGHSNGADYNLYEGNIAPQIFEDNIHGPHLMETFNGNFLTGWESCSNGNCGVTVNKNSNVSTADVTSYNRYGAWTGNILGTPTIAATYSDCLSGSYSENNIIWVLGSGNSGGKSDSIPCDTNVRDTIMRWGNWDVVTNATRFCTANATPIVACTADERGDGATTYPALSSPSTTFPASFYLLQRPSWWSALIPFPAIGPGVTGGNVGKCGGTPNAAGQYALLPATNASQCAGQGLSAAWGGHVNATPALKCYLEVLSGPPDGTGSILPFDASLCY